MKVISDQSLPEHIAFLSPQLVDDVPEGEAFWLSYCEGRLALCQPKKIGPIVVDFVGGKSRHRRLQGGGKGQAVSKACGLVQRRDLDILDATAGMGGDGFVLASLGAKLTSLERNPVVYSLLADGFYRLNQATDSSLKAIADRWQLLNQSASDYLAGSPKHDVVYLDPMFPARKKEKAAVAKEMVAFHSLVGADEDADALLAPALECARFRVVVKRPKIAPLLAGKQPDLQLVGKSSRFDVYTKAKIVAD